MQYLIFMQPLLVVYKWCVAYRNNEEKAHVCC